MLYRLLPGPPVFLSLLCLILPNVPAGGAIAPEPASARARTLAAHQFTSLQLAVWQQRLNLENWKISIVISRAKQLKHGTLGNIHWDTDKKTAVIRVLDPADYRLPWDDMLKDMEFTVVHELVHLELASLPRSEASRGQEEQAVNQLADALLNLARGNK